MKGKLQGRGWVRLAITALFFVNGLAMASWFVRIPAIKSRLGLSTRELELALLCVAAGAILVMLLSSGLVERRGVSRATRPSGTPNVLQIPHREHR